MSSFEETRQGEHAFKILQTRLQSIKSCVELPKVQRSGNKNIQLQRRFTNFKKNKRSIHSNKRPSNEEKQTITMTSLLTQPLSPDTTPG